jgi:D-alanyl-D-alanine carboxypeptidase
MIANRTKYFPYLLGGLAVIAVLLYWATWLGFSKLAENQIKSIPVSPFKNITLSAKSAYVLDLSRDTVIYEKNAEAPQPLASLTKVMTVLTAQTLASKLKYITITPDDLAPEGDTGLKINSVWKLKDLIDYSMVVSSNDGASAIARAGGEVLGGKNQTFINKMNTLAQALGLTQSKFINEHGLDKDLEHAGAYGSARDMGTLFKFILTHYPHLMEATSYDSLIIKDESGDIYNAVNTNVTVNDVPSLIASKTGLTDLAGGNLVIAFDAGLERPVIISVLGSSEEGRFTDMLKLVSAARKYIQEN